MRADDARVSEALALGLADLGTALKALGNVAEAQERYQQAVQVHPSCAAAHYNLGVITSEAKMVGARGGGWENLESNTDQSFDGI